MYGTLLTMPVIALEHVMTCRVHRAVILGLITSKQPPNETFLLTTFVGRGDIMQTDKGLDAKERLELQEAELA